MGSKIMGYEVYFRKYKACISGNTNARRMYTRLVVARYSLASYVASTGTVVPMVPMVHVL